MFGHIPVFHTILTNSLMIVRCFKRLEYVTTLRRHVWANTCLSYNSDKLLDDSAMLQAFGIRNNSQVHFAPYVVSRVHMKHSRRKKHRFFHGLSKRSQQIN